MGKTVADKICGPRPQRLIFQQQSTMSAIASRAQQRKRQALNGCMNRIRSCSDEREVAHKLVPNAF
jgi:hypothetical protein